MKLLTLLLLLSCGQVVAQKSPLLDTSKTIIGTYGTTGGFYPMILERRSDAMKGVYFLPDGSFQIVNLDSTETIKLLYRNYEELQEKLQQLRDAFQKSVTFSNTIPLTYKNSKEWKEFLSVMQKLGYEVIKK